MTYPASLRSDEERKICECKVAVMLWNRWPVSRGLGGRHAVYWVSVFPWNDRPSSCGITVHFPWNVQLSLLHPLLHPLLHSLLYPFLAQLFGYGRHKLPSLRKFFKGLAYI